MFDNNYNAGRPSPQMQGFGQMQPQVMPGQSPPFNTGIVPPQQPQWQGFGGGMIGHALGQAMGQGHNGFGFGQQPGSFGDGQWQMPQQGQGQRRPGMNSFGFG